MDWNMCVKQDCNNAGGLSHLIIQNSSAALREQAIAQLMLELKKGEDSVHEESDWISEEDMLAEFGTVE